MHCGGEGRLGKEKDQLRQGVLGRKTGVSRELGRSMQYVLQTSRLFRGVCRWEKWCVVHNFLPGKSTGLISQPQVLGDRTLEQACPF